MAKRRRTAAQKAATQKMLAANKRRHHNPSHRTYKAKRRYRNPAPVHYRHRRRQVHRNPGGIFSGGGIFKELLSMEGALMVGAAFAAPMACDFVQEKIMPSATGWTKIAVKAAVSIGGAWLIAKFLKKPKVALAFGVTGLAVNVADAVKIAQGQLKGLSADQADMLANRPDLVQAIATGNMGEPYTTGLAEPYAVGMADYYNSPISAGMRGFSPAFQSAF